MAAQTALLGPLCRGVRLRGLAPIMIDWSDLGQGRNGLFPAVRNRQPGSASAQFGVHAPGVEPVPEPSGGVLPAQTALPSAPNHPSPPFDEPGFRAGQPDPFRSADASPHRLRRGLRDPLKRDVLVRSVHYRGRLRDYPLCKGPHPAPATNPVPSDGAMIIHLILYWAQGHREPWYLATSLADPRRAVRMYRKRMQPEHHIKSLPRAATRGAQATLQAGSEQGDHTDRLQRYWRVCCWPAACWYWRGRGFHHHSAVKSAPEKSLASSTRVTNTASPVPTQRIFMSPHRQTGYA